MDIKIYIKNFDDDKGGVIAAVQKEELIDNCKVWLFIDVDPVQFVVYEGDAMKLNGLGRPLWAQITNPSSGKWTDITNIPPKPVDVHLLVKELMAPEFHGQELNKLKNLFDRPRLQVDEAVEESAT